MIILLPSLLLWSLILFYGNAVNGESMDYSNCDENSIPANQQLSSLTPNTFHKICPGTSTDTSKPLSQPKCGDGTAFSFYYHKPSQSHFNKDKVLIEFQGGGACWDANSCQKQQDLLTFPTDLDGFIGYSCSTVNYGMGNYGGYPINLLCATTIGGTLDLSDYNYIFVPYCTQDVHMGDNIASYNDNNNGSSGVYHHGAHNMMGVLNWVYKHFPNPSHIFLTGCSAGGTALPLAYGLINGHYNSFLKGGRTVNINTIIDSAVYLTPSYFLEYGIDNWNPWTALAKIMFPYNKYKYNINYSTRLWEHVLGHASRKDKWGFVTHTYDPVSIAYWQAMGGAYGDDDNDSDDEVSWTNHLESSLSTIQGEYSNVDVFYINGNGHCSFGLEYALQEDGFDEFALNIMKEQQIARKTASSFPFFSLSAALGLLLALTASISRSKREKVVSNEYTIEASEPSPQKSKWSLFKRSITALLNPILPLVQRYEKCPITSGIFLTVTLYFIFMLIEGGFDHPFNNPSLGPSATTLSTYGINNPTLIVEKKQVIRLFSSSFLCSGVLTYLIFTRSVFKCMRHVEAALSSNIVFATVLFIIGIGSNLIYTLVGQGASCGSLALSLGLNTFSITMSRKYGFDLQFPRPWFAVVINTLFGVLLFPFNSWIMIVAALLLGAFVAPMAVKMDDYFSVQSHIERVKKGVLVGILVIYFVMFVLILCNVPKPDTYYQYAYLTGCSMMYTYDLQSIMDDFGFGGRRRMTTMRQLGGDGFNYDELCAQVCVPHLIDKPFYYGVGRFTDYTVSQGRCLDNGYSVHAVDKTITYLGYSLDVEGYFADDNNNNRN